MRDALRGLVSFALPLVVAVAPLGCSDDDEPGEDELASAQFAVTSAFSRFYLPSAGTAAVSPAFATAWNTTTGADRRPLAHAKTTTAIAEKSAAEISASAGNYLLRQFVSAPLAAQTIPAGVTVKGQISGSESNTQADMRTHLVVRIVTSTGTARATLFTSDTTTTTTTPPELPTTSTNRKLPRNGPAALTGLPFTVNDGDRLVVEVGYRYMNTSTTSRTGYLRFGDNQVTDLAENETDTATTTKNPWIQLSSAIALQTRALTVTTVGTGTVTSGDTPQTVNCGADCTESYLTGTAVTLTATPGGGSIFAGWSGGGCSGTGTCVVTMGAAATVTATFGYPLTVSRTGSGTGTVTSAPAGVNCGADCAETYASGTAVTLTASPGAGSVFGGWSGACSGTGGCAVSMTAALAVTAVFSACGNAIVEAGEQCDGGTCCSTTCQFSPAGNVCRVATGECDAAETCSGGDASCPVDQVAPSTVACGPTPGASDCFKQDHCSGTSTACVDAGLVAAGAKTCRAPTGPCDAPEACDGASAVCPATDGFVAAGALCRPITGLCDSPETCTGTGPACPADAFVATGTQCRSAIGICDVAEACTGGSANCPVDGYVAAGSQCRGPAGDCDLAETCTGADALCPGDAFRVAGASCRSAAGVCDVAEACTGTGAACPSDALVAAGATCRTATGACDVVETCSGASTACPADALVNGICGAPVADFTAEPEPGGVALSWANPSGAGFLRVEVFRASDGTAVSTPNTTPQLRIYSGVGEGLLDISAPGTGLLHYYAFAIYNGGWAVPAQAAAQRDDFDGDGMTNACEIAHGLNPQSSSDAALDPDGDGLSNVMECTLGSNPSAADTDGDGLSDGEEVEIGTDPTKQDTDGDGMTDGFEISMGLDPNNGHDFAIGNFSASQNFRMGAYVVDSGAWRPGGYTSGPNSRSLITASQAQMTGIGTMGGTTGFGWAGYLYTVEEFIAPNYPPGCNAGLDQTVKLPATVLMSASATDPNGDPLTYSWSFVYVPPVSALTTANIAGATTATPSFTPDTFGYYTLELAVTDVLGVSGAPCYVVVTAVEDDLFFFTGPYMAFSPNHKLMAGTTSTAGGFPTAATSPSFQIGFATGDRSPDGLAASPAPGRQVEAGFRAAAFAQFDLTQNISPVADAGVDQTVSFGTAVALSGLASADPDGSPSPLTYTWSFWQKPWGSAAAITSPTAAVTSFTPDKAGSYVVLLRVSDGEATSVPDPVVITVANTPPLANAGPDQIVSLTSPAPVVTLDGSGSSDPEGVALAYTWRFYAKPAASAATLTGATTAQPSFTPDVVGYYRLELVVKDQILVSDPAYITVTVGSASGNLPPVAAIGPDQSLLGVNSTGLDGTGSGDPDWDTATNPDPDATGVYRRGLGYDWSIISRPGTCSDSGAVCYSAAGCTSPATCNLSTATIACTTAQSPAWDCPNPVLAFNGYNGNYTIGLRVADPDMALSDLVTMQVAVTGLVNQAPVAVARPPFTTVNMELPPANRHAFPDGSTSYDPLDPAEALTYQWTLPDSEKPAGSAAVVTNATSALAQLTIDLPGQYRVHLRVCDTAAKCSCAIGEIRPDDPTCNVQSWVTINTLTAAQRVAMPANWPGVGSPGGSGGHMILQMGDDGVYDRPVVLTAGFAALEEAAAAVFGQGVDGGEIKVLQTRLRKANYDVWYLSYDPVCSGGATPNLDAKLAIGSAEDCAGGNCTCAFPQVPVDNAIQLNAVVAAKAIERAKQYGACGSKSPDDPVDPCFVRTIGRSNGGLIFRYALAWAEDPSETTVPGAVVAAKPPGVSVWDLGARVMVTADTPHQGANVPVSLQGLVKQFEEAGNLDTRLPLKTYSGIEVIGVWLFLQSESIRKKTMTADPDSDDSPSRGDYMLYQTIAAIGAGALLGPVGVVMNGFLWGYAQGAIAGVEWGIVGGVLLGAWSTFQAILWIANPALGALVAALDYYLGIGDFIFNVTVSPQKATLPGTNATFTPFPIAPILDSPAAKQMLYERVIAQQGCLHLKMLLQGNSVSNTRPTGFGKITDGWNCNGTLAVTTTTEDHDQFYASLNALNTEHGNPGYPTLTRNLGMTLGSLGQTSVTSNLMMELYLPYTYSNQQYPLGPRDHQPGSIVGDAIQGHLLTWKYGIKVWLDITVRVFGIKVKKKQRLIVEDYARWYDLEPRWPFITTESSADFRRPGACDAALPCCQMLPPGVPADPADGADGNCCSCQTGLDAVYSSPRNLHHIPYMQVNPCLTDLPEDPQFIKDERAACLSPVQDPSTPICDQDADVLVPCRLCGADKPVYLNVTPNGYLCGTLPEGEAVVATRLWEAIITQLNTRPSCADTSATFVCENGLTSCPADQGFWLWQGGIDRDADGCPGRYGCGSYCETDLEDSNPTCKSCTTGSTGGPVGNLPPVISAVSGPQSFALPVCAAGSDLTFTCLAKWRSGTVDQPLTASVTASDPNGDPVRYQWEFLPDGDQQPTDVWVDATSPTPVVRVSTVNRSPQGVYRLQVTARDNKGGVTTAETSVIVTGDAAPAVSAAGPGELPEICELQPEPDNGDAWRCYAELTLQGSATDPDGPDSTSIILLKWDDVTDPSLASPYRAARMIVDPHVGNAALMIYSSEAHATTISGTCSNNAAQCQRDADCSLGATCTGAVPLRYRLTAVDLRGQIATKEVQVALCPVDGCPP